MGGFAPQTTQPKSIRFQLRYNFEFVFKLRFTVEALNKQIKRIQNPGLWNAELMGQLAAEKQQKNKLQNNLSSLKSQLKINASNTKGNMPLPRIF